MPIISAPPSPARQSASRCRGGFRGRERGLQGVEDRLGHLVEVGRAFKVVSFTWLGLAKSKLRTRPLSITHSSVAPCIQAADQVA